MKNPLPQTVHLVYWYHDKDAFWQEALEAHLKLFRDFITPWHYGNIPPGADWQQEIHSASSKADIILLLVSSDFLADDSSYERIKQAVERHKRKEVHVVPIILRPVVWQQTVLGSLDVLPAQGTLVMKDGRLDEEALSKVATILAKFAKMVLREKKHVHCIREGDASLADDGDYEAALQAYELALQLFSSEKPQDILYAYIHDTFVLPDYRNPPDILRKKAKLSFVLKQYKKAWNAYEQLILSGSMHIPDYIHLAEVCYRVGYPGNAREAYQNALRLEPKNAILHYYLANCSLYHLQNYEDAVASYEQAIQYDPSHAQWYIEKGHALRCRGRYDEALKAYDAAIQIDPGNALAFTNKGLTLYELKEYEPALKAYRQAIFLDPTNAMAYLGMATVLHSLSNSEYEEALIQAEQRGYSSSLGSVPNLSGFAPEPPIIPRSGLGTLCVHRHKNPPGSVWCEQCEEPLGGGALLGRSSLADSFVL